MAHHAGLHIHACRVKNFRWGRVLERAVEGARAKIFETERRELFSGTDVYVEDCGELKKPVPERPQLFGGGRSGFNSAWGRELEGVCYVWSYIYIYEGEHVWYLWVFVPRVRWRDGAVFERCLSVWG